jgi:hypothetical protein
MGAPCVVRAVPVTMTMTMTMTRQTLGRSDKVDIVLTCEVCKIGLFSKGLKPKINVSFDKQKQQKNEWVWDFQAHNYWRNPNAHLPFPLSVAYFLPKHWKWDVERGQLQQKKAKCAKLPIELSQRSPQIKTIGSNVK